MFSGVPRLKVPCFFLPCALLLSTAAGLSRAQEPTTAPPQQKGESTTQKAGKTAAQRPDLGQTFFGLAAKPDAAAVERGGKNFVANCGFCHGSNALGGNAGPNLVRSVLVLHDEGTGKEIGPVILNGRVNKGMPKFAFSEAQIKDIAAFLLSRSQAAVVRMDYKTQNIVTGNAAAGKVYFDKNCTTCHSASADLAHVGSKYEPEALQTRFLYPETPRRRGEAVDPNSKTQPTAKVSRAGQTVEGTVTYVDDFNISVLDKDGENRTWSREDPALKVEIHDPLKGHADLLPHYTDADMHNLLAYLVTLK